MIKQLKRHLYLNRHSLLFGLVLCVGASLLITGLVAVIAHVAGPQEGIIGAGRVVFIACGLLYAVIQGISMIGVQYNQQLKMGAVRRYYLTVAVAFNCVVSYILLLASYLWQYVERLLIPGVNGTEDLTAALNRFNPLLMLAVAAAVALAGYWIGAILVRYGKKGFWVIWALWMLLALGGGQLSNLLNPERTDPLARCIQAVAGFLQSMPGSNLLIVGAVLAAALTIHAILITRRMAAQD